MTGRIRQTVLNAALAVVIMNLALTLPLCFRDVRELVHAVNPGWLASWVALVRLGWLAAGGSAGAVKAWEWRGWWMPLLGGLGRRVSRGKAQPVAVAPVGPVEAVPALAGGPPLDLLGARVPIEVKPCPETAKQVKAALQALGVQGCEVVRHFGGPVVAVVQVRPPEGVKASGVIALADDLAAYLGTRSATIAPVVGAPGVLQVELTGSHRATVALRTLIESDAYRRAGTLPLVAGVNAAGASMVADLTELPHLLIAGTTGAGKSYFLRQVLAGLLYRLGPEQLQVVLIDPKLVEMALFRGIPHLRQEIITTPEEAVRALQDLVFEMEQRYVRFEQEGVTNIQSYNRKHPAQRLPYIVTIVDELADLMLSGGRKLTEGAIQRLAQKGRACGIHLVVATQRPSVDVITGTIKAVIPARVALRVASNVDSRTILDYGGAERLRGQGDLYFRPISEVMRGQAADVPDELVGRVVEWWRRRSSPSGVEAPVPAVVPPAPVPVEAPEDAGLRWVKEYALEHGVISRRIVAKGLSIGNTRANALVQELDELGWLAPQIGPHPRRVMLGVEERRGLLAGLRGVPVGDVHVVVPVEEPRVRGLLADVHGLERRVHEVLGRRATDPDEARRLLAEIDGLIDRALDEANPEAFASLVARRQAVQAWLGEEQACEDMRGRTSLPVLRP